jgi:hypothetical protein
MGFARRVVRKSVRKATPRSVRRAMHPVRTAKYAVTPRAVRQISRGVYTVTNPLGAAENALIGAALNGGRRRSTASRGGRSRATTYSGGATVSELRAAEGAASHDDLADLMAVHRTRFAPAQRPVLEPPDPVDPQPFFVEEWAQRKREVRLWQRGRRRLLQAEIRAHAQAHADRQLALAQVAHAAEQVRVDAWWAALGSGAADVVIGALAAAFADNPAPVTILSAGGAEANLVVWLPRIEVLPERKAHVTPGGRLSSKAWTKTELNGVYADLLGAHLLATFREMWAVAPSLTRARVAGVVRTSGVSDEAVFDVTVDRGSARWDSDGLGVQLLEGPGGLQRAGRTREVRGWPLNEIASDVASLIHRP